MKKFFLRLFAILFIVIMTTGCDFDMEVDDLSYAYPDSKDTIVTLEEFNQLKTGMSENEVWNIIGGKCTLTGETSIDGLEEYKTISYGCNGKGKIGANVILMFQGGKLSTMSQAGLK